MVHGYQVSSVVNVQQTKAKLTIICARPFLCPRVFVCVWVGGGDGDARRGGVGIAGCAGTAHTGWGWVAGDIRTKTAMGTDSCTQ